MQPSRIPMQAGPSTAQEINGSDDQKAGGEHETGSYSMLVRAFEQALEGINDGGDMGEHAMSS